MHSKMWLCLLVFGLGSCLVECQRRTCAVPGIPVNSELTDVKHHFEHGDYVRYKCREGFFMKGNPSRRCHYGSWTTVNFICDGSCTLFYLDRNIQLTSDVPGLTTSNGSVVPPHTKLTVKCKPHYEVYDSIKDKFPDNVTVTCANMDALPTCAEQRCRVDGTVEGHCYHPDKKHWCFHKQFYVRSGKSIYLRCTGNYTMQQLDGNNIKRVNGNNNGNNKGMLCTRGILSPRYQCAHDQGRACGLPDVPANSGLLQPPVEAGHVYREGDIVQYLCKAGYITRGNILRRCRNGTWTDVNFICDAMCPPLNGIQHGRISQYSSDGIRDKYESVAVYTCTRGYRVFGTELEYRRTCQLNGTWSGSEPYCEAPMCDDISPLPGGDIYYPTGRNEHSSAFFTCNDGYVLHPEKNVKSKCKEVSGKFTWSPKPPICRNTRLKYVVRMQIADRLNAGTDGNVYVRIHGHGDYAAKFRMKGVFDRNGLEETEFKGLEIRPIHKVVVEVGNGYFGENQLCMIYVSIFIEDTDEYYVFQSRPTHWIRAYRPESIHMSGHPERCVHTYSEALNRAPKTLGHREFFNSLRECKQRCVTTLSMECKGIYFRPRKDHKKGFGDCYHYTHSPDGDHYRNNTANETLDHYVSYKRICQMT